MDLDFLLKLAQLVALLSFVIFVFAGISLFSQLKRILKSSEEKLDRLENNINDLKKSSIEVLSDVNENINLTVKELNHTQKIAQTRLEEFQVTNININDFLVSAKNLSEAYTATGYKINEKIDEVDGIIQPIKKLVDDTYNSVYKPIKDFSKIANAVQKGFSAFKHKFASK